MVFEFRWLSICNVECDEFFVMNFIKAALNFALSFLRIVTLCGKMLKVLIPA